MSQNLNPDDFVITRRRKKYKFARFANAKNCFEFSEWAERPVDSVEIGAGTGLLSVELAQRYPEKVFVAIDVKADRLQTGAYQALAQGLNNVYFIRARADQVTELFAAQSLASIWLTFPDPYPKKRAAGRRMTHPSFLALYKKLLRPDGVFILKHDNAAFFEWSLEQLVATRWQLKELYFDLHESPAADDYKILTTYEQRWLDEGRCTKLVVASYKE